MTAGNRRLGGWWGEQSVGGARDPEPRDADSDGVDRVWWVGGGRRAAATSRRLEPVEDAARAGYNLLLNRAATNTTSATEPALPGGDLRGMGEPAGLRRLDGASGSGRQIHPHL